MNSSRAPTPTLALNFKSAITLTPPTVGRPSAEPIKCQILALFSSADKNKIITTLLLLFFHRPTVFGFWQSADDRPDNRPISRPMSYLKYPLFIGRCVGRPSADRRPIVARLKGNRLMIGRSSDDRPIVQFCDFLSKSVRIVFNVIASVGRQIDVYRPIKIQKSYRPTVFFNEISALYV